MCLAPPRRRAPPLPPPSRTNWTRLVPPSVLTGHVSSLPPQVAACARAEGALTAVAEAGTRLAGEPGRRDGAAPSVLAALEAAQEAEMAALVEALRGGEGAPLGALGRRKLCAAARLGVEPPPFPPPPPSPAPRTKWTRRVPHPVLIGHAASLTPY